MYFFFFLFFLKKPFISNFFLMGYSCFTMSCQFLLHSEVNQPCVCGYIYIYMYIYPLPLGPPSHESPPAHLSRSPQNAELSPLGCTAGSHYLFYARQCIFISPNLTVHPTPPSTLCPYVHSLVCISIPALQIGLSLPFFQIPHICIKILYLFISF